MTITGGHLYGIEQAPDGSRCRHIGGLKLAQGSGASVCELCGARVIYIGPVDPAPTPRPWPPRPPVSAGAITVEFRIDVEPLVRALSQLGQTAREAQASFRRLFRETLDKAARAASLRHQARRKGKPGWRRIKIPGKPRPQPAMLRDSPPCAAFARPMAEPFAPSRNATEAGETPHGTR